ncbi:DUF4286 family protein [Variovorax sp. YR216]|uniref:DUF4286 family protein n=1 Tax=Variovorax sp. YR216 TaxID=1882828 RepID=UPI000899FBB2|nr:DUF4286 family protein [Variovorax sp. YR216]SEB06593.1 hypothetical protein SAMN05444680_106259 [Variovorax sp. YR216]
MNDDTTGAGAVLALWNDVTPEMDAEYNAWHANEHVPERLTVPGMLWGRRYRRLSDDAAPRYLTIYGMRDARVVESEAYRLLLSQPTAMSARMRPHLCNLSRWVCDVRESQEFGESTHVAAWTFEEEKVARLRAAEHASTSSGLLLGRRSLDAVPLPWLRGDQAHAIEGSWFLTIGLPDEVMAASVPAPGAMLYRAL